MTTIIETVKTAAKTDTARIAAQVIATGAALVAVHIVTKKMEGK